MSAMTVAGNWDCTIATPMGEHKGLLEVAPVDAAHFNGRISGDMGSLDIPDGRIAGNNLSWQMKLSMPLPMTLDCTAIVDGDMLSGHVRAGLFGTMTLAGVRRG